MIIYNRIAFYLNKWGIKSKIGRFKKLKNQHNNFSIIYSIKCGHKSIFKNLSSNDILKSINYVSLIQERYYQVKFSLKCPDIKVPGTLSKKNLILHLSETLDINLFLDMVNKELAIEKLVDYLKSSEEDFQYSSLRSSLGGKKYEFVIEFIPCFPPKNEHEKDLLEFIVLIDAKF